MDIIPYIGEIRMFAGQKAPKEGWALCDGSLLPVTGHEMLYAKIGNTFGGDDSTFGLPDLRGRVAVHVSSKADTVNLSFGQQAGNERTVVTMNNFPPHTHQVLAIEGDAGTNDPAKASLAKTGTLNLFQMPASDGSDKIAMHPDAVATEGVDYSVPVVQYYQTINYIIALTGIY